MSQTPISNPLRNTCARALTRPEALIPAGTFVQQAVAQIPSSTLAKNVTPGAGARFARKMSQLDALYAIAGHRVNISGPPKNGLQRVKRGFPPHSSFVQLALALTMIESRSC